MKVHLDTDTRQVRRDHAGFYTVGAGKSLCTLCAARINCAFADKSDKCQMFLPALTFADETGLEKVANTMRVGRAWTQRLDIPQTVALYNTKAKVIFGYADAIAMDDGKIVPMLKAHAHANHLMLGTPNNEAPTKLGAWMKQNYGPRIIHENTTLTAIYLLRLHEPPLAPHLQGLEAPGVGKGGAADPRKAGRE